MRTWMGAAARVTAVAAVTLLAAGVAAAAAPAVVAASSAPAAPEPIAPATSTETLVVFVRTSGSPVARTFAERDLPGISRMADSLGIALRIVDVMQAGAPAEIVLTPQCVFQNAAGRSLFVGRPNEPERLALFLRMARRIPLSAGGATPSADPMLEDGRARVAAAVKVTALTGNVPAGFDHDRFRREAAAAVASGFRRFRAPRDSGAAADRTFHLDVYPYRDEAGVLNLTLALFSPFHCTTPVFRLFEEPLSGPFEDAARLCAAAGTRLEEEALRVSRSPDGGDGFDPVPKDTPVVSWESLGLPLPAAPSSRAAAPPPTIALPRRWELPAADGAAPRLLFHFDEPVDHYAGEIAAVTGDLSWTETGLSGARAAFEAAMATITMGDSDLDRELRGKMLRTVRFPAARFELDGLEASDPEPAFGRVTRITARGRLTCLGVEIPIEASGTLEPVLAADGAPRLLVQAGTRLRLGATLGLEAPAGPWPAADTLWLILNAELNPKSRQ